jgi:hypothetical protein
MSQVPEKFKKHVGNIEYTPEQTVHSYNELDPFVETNLKLNQLKKNLYEDHTVQNYTLQDLKPGYVAFACSNPIEENRDILLIREDVVSNSQLMSLLAFARPVFDLGEVVFLQNSNATLQNMKTICEWIACHLDFESLGNPDQQRLDFDNSFFKRHDYKEVMQLMHLSIFLELHPLVWHVDYTRRESMKPDYDKKPIHEKFPEYAHEICANVLGDMMASCNTPIELQSMFPELIGDQSLTTQDKYNIIVNDAWIHGDHGVNFLLNKLKEKSGDQIQEWNIHNSDRNNMLEELGLAPDAVINPVRLKGENDTGIEEGANWWG